jgi:hypothetical protein
MTQMAPAHHKEIAMSPTPARPTIFIATPCYGGMVSQGYMQSIIALLQYANGAGFDAMLALLGHDSLITRSRNTLVTQFLNTSQATHLMFIDADIGFEPAHIKRMLAHDQDLVAGMYPLKVIDWGRQARQHLNGGETPQTAPLLYVGTLCSGAELERSGSFATGVYCGAGFMLIKRRAIERMIAAYPHTRYESIHAHTNARGAVNHALFDCFIDASTGTYLSEDYGFCHRWRAIGGKIWLDTEGVLTHVGAHDFVGDPKTRFRDLALFEGAHRAGASR